jgi:hypothetical protein
MELEITPEPDPAERRAIEAALAEPLDERLIPPQERSAWRSAGFDETKGAPEQA